MSAEAVGAELDEELDDELVGAVPVFGQGGDDPYRSRLRDSSPRRLALHRLSSLDGPVDGGAGGNPCAPPLTTWRMEALRAPADRADLHAIDGVEGPLLDVGCGPGRMLVAAVARGVTALGVDVAHEAAAATAERGGSAVVGSVFAPLPGEGTWRTVLLMDGNLGIGGDPEALISRCAELLGPGGRLVVEADAADDADERGWYVVVDDLGGRSEPFPWARLGHAALLEALVRCGFTALESRTSRGRRFVHAARAA